MTLKCHIILEDEVKCRIGGLRSEHLEILHEKFAFFAEGYRWMPAFQLRRWNGKINFFDKTGKFYTKLIHEAIPYITSWGYEVTYEDRRIPAPEILERVDEMFFGIEGFKLRPYQVEVVNTLLSNRGGFAIVGTGGGKTSMCAAISAVLAVNQLQVLVIVPSIDLVTQTAKEFRERLAFYPITIGEYSGGTKEIDHPIVIATWQSLQNVPHYMSYFQAVIVDEAHGAKAEVVKSLINDHGAHIAYRYGCTGTFPKPVTDQYNLRLSIGEKLVEIPSRWLIDNGYLSEVSIHPIETIDEDMELPDYASEKSYLSLHDERLPALANVIQEKRDEHGNTLVLVNSIKQGKALAALIPGSIFLYGESDTELREQNYQRYADQDGLIIIASAGIASTGISIDRIFCMIMVDTGKSFIRCIQSVGRGLRKKGDKSFVWVYDIYSRLKFSKKHFKIRKQHYLEAEYPLCATIKVKYG